ncbi:hypothetical protein [Rhodopirellula bahusiensis]|nr:hypothetical protein [Rhodopirellula bahusiensis]
MPSPTPVLAKDVTHFESPLSRQSRNVLKNFLAKTFSKHVHSEESIFFFVTRRSGSTWVTESIAKQARVRYCEDPLIDRNLHEHYRKLLPHPDFQFMSVGEHAAELHEYISGLQNGRYSAGCPWNPLRSDFHKSTTKCIFKFANAFGIAPWLCDIFSAQSLFMFRHPIPTCLSQEKWGLKPYTHAFVQDEKFYEECLSSKQRALIERLLSEGDPLALRVADWCLENLIPFRYLLDNSDSDAVMALTYEELCGDYHSLMKQSFTWAGIEQTCVLKPGDPSKTQSKEMKQGLSASGKKFGSWLKTVPKSYVTELMSITDQFEIDIYAANDSIPRRFIHNTGDFEQLC